MGFDYNKEVTIDKPEESFNVKVTGELIVDTHEPDKIFNLLIKNGIKFKKETLPIGDFVKDGVCIERKSMSDFIGSVRTRHLQKQVMQMETNFDKSFIIISGNLKDVYFSNPHLKGWTINHQMGALASLAVRYPKTKILQVDNDTQLVNLMSRIMIKAFDGKVPTIYETELLKSKMTNEDTKTMMLGCIPKIGMKKAKELTDIIDVVLFDKATQDVLEEEHLDSIKGIGPMIAEEILKINGD